MKIVDGSGPKLYAINGSTSYYFEGMIESYISKYGCRAVFGPDIARCLVSGYQNVYTFAFMAPIPTKEQRKFLEENSIVVSFECDRVPLKE